MNKRRNDEGRYGRRQEGKRELPSKGRRETRHRHQRRERSHDLRRRPREQDHQRPKYDYELSETGKKDDEEEAKMAHRKRKFGQNTAINAPNSTLIQNNPEVDTLTVASPPSTSENATNIVVQVQAARTSATITIDNEPVVVSCPNASNNYRGLHIVVINPHNGQVSNATVFDTYKSSATLEIFIKDKVPQGHIVVAASKDECVRKLSDSVKMWFMDMGSEEVG